MKKAGKTLMAHKDKIMAYFRDHITNAISEGINSLIHQTTKSRPPDADGFSSVALLANY
jgi:transposase